MTKVIPESNIDLDRLSSLMWIVHYSTIEEVFEYTKALQADRNLIWQGNVYSLPKDIYRLRAVFSPTSVLAELTGQIGFWGGPTGETYYRGTLATYLDDFIMYSCFKHGISVVANTLGLDL